MRKRIVSAWTILLTWFALIASPVAIAQPASPEAPDTAYEEGWYRDVRMDMWTWDGAEREVIEATLARIEEADGERRWPDKADTILAYGPGHWTYEFAATGDDALREARKLEGDGDMAAAMAAYRAAAIYYMVASFPHFREDHARAALEKAHAAYQDMGRLRGERFETWRFEVDGAAFNAYVHWPEDTSEPVPVILKTGGMDAQGTFEYFPLAEDLNRDGVAMIGFDMPGNGNDGIVDANAHKHHAAVLDRVLEDPRFDHDRIVAWSESLGGLPVVKLAATHEAHLAAVVNHCGILHGILAMEFGEIPQEPDTPGMEALIAAYTAGQLSPEEVEEIEAGFAESPAYQAFADYWQFHVFLDRIEAASPGVLDLGASSFPISLVNQGILGAGQQTRVPILTINTQADPLVPVEESLLAAQVSERGTLMLFGDHPGHCLARELSIPAVLHWLEPYLESGSNEN